MNPLKYILLAIGVILILYFVFFSKKAPKVEEKTLVDGGNCISPPSQFRAYNQNVNWGDFAKGIRDYLGDYDTYQKYAHGFLKGANVEANSTYVKYYQDEIRQYMQDAKALPHWEVVAGQFNCQNKINQNINLS